MVWESPHAAAVAVLEVTGVGKWMRADVEATMQTVGKRQAKMGGVPVAVCPATLLLAVQELTRSGKPGRIIQPQQLPALQFINCPLVSTETEPIALSNGSTKISFTGILLQSSQDNLNKEAGGPDCRLIYLGQLPGPVRV